MRLRFKIIAGGMLFPLLCGCGQSTAEKLPPGAGGEVLYVSSSADPAAADGSRGHPFQQIQDAVDASRGGTEIVVGGGEYGPFEIPARCSGTEADRTVVKAAEGARPVIRTPSGSAGKDSVGISMENVAYIRVSGLEISGGTHGIYYESNADADGTALSGVTIQACRVHDVHGVHGIAVYAANDKIPVTDVVIEGCEIYDCRCGGSESLAVNGNIDGFEIRGNWVHDNDNIGIDMIGFEGTAIHDAAYAGNRYDADFVRNGICRGNTVCGITAYGNRAYLENGEYSLCAGGIYVDGGQNIDIYGNTVSDCDIGIEVATEHSLLENPLFRVAGVNVHDNTITGCTGFAGLAFGGYDGERGFTEECRFYRNTLTDNPVQIAVQRSRDNEIDHNTLIGGELMIEYHENLPREEMDNDFHDNTWEKAAD